MKPKRVYVGMSGGVDSSVSAALLKNAGHDVVGVFIKVWQPDFIECTAAADQMDAMRVAAELGIPFKTLDLESQYKKEVIDYLLKEYAAGRTPNPDVCCNQYIKFGAFLSWAIEEGADTVATGHYAQIQETAGGPVLLAGEDLSKDQSYFLWTLTRQQLSKIIFPVGSLTKPAVRLLAHKLKLSVADKKDSQGLCFVGKIDMKEFLAHYIKAKKGEVLNEKGGVIGFHDGSWFFTIGERHGFTVTQKTPNDLPLYVISKDVEKNTITVGARDSQKQGSFGGRLVKINHCNWITQPEEKKYFARCRYRQPLAPCRVILNSNSSADVEFEEPQLVASGQSLVLYDDGKCMGGGIII